MPIKSMSNYSARKVYEYPKLMIDRCNTVVLFSAAKNGVVVEGDNSEEVGNYSSGWGMSQFKDYHGDVTLTNC